MTRQALALPTGTGKTIVFAELIRRRGGRALILVHRDELVRQAVEKLSMVAPDLPVGIVKAEMDETEAPVVVASVQTLSRPRRLERLGQDFNTFVIDEGHHAVAETYGRVIDHLADVPLLLGVSATIERGDGAALGEVFQEVVYERGILDMMQAGYLCDLRGVQVRLAADFGELHTRMGDFVESEAEELLLDANAPRQAAEAYQKHAAGRKTLIFTPTVRLAHAMAAAFIEAGVDAEALDGTTPIDDRRAILGRLRTGETRVVANCAVLTEGFDEPAIECIVMARPTKSRPFYVQMVGRGTRIYPGKPDCLILDLVGATTRHDLMTTATLFGVEPKAASKGIASAVAEKQEEDEEEAEGRLIARRVDLFNRRRFAWAVDGGHSFALPTGDGVVALSEGPEGWVVLLVTRLRKEVLAHGVDLGYAQGVAEDYVRKVGAERLADRNAPWRQRAASQKQRTVLERMRLPRDPGMNQGEASDLISAALARRVS